MKALRTFAPYRPADVVMGILLGSALFSSALAEPSQTVLTAQIAKMRPESPEALLQAECRREPKLPRCSTSIDPAVPAPPPSGVAPSNMTQPQRRESSDTVFLFLALAATLVVAIAVFRIYRRNESLKESLRLALDKQKAVADAGIAATAANQPAQSASFSDKLWQPDMATPAHGLIDPRDVPSAPDRTAKRLSGEVRKFSKDKLTPQGAWAAWAFTLYQYDSTGAKSRQFTVRGSPFNGGALNDGEQVTVDGYFADDGVFYTSRIVNMETGASYKLYEEPAGSKVFRVVFLTLFFTIFLGFMGFFFFAIYSAFHSGNAH